jgi:HAD superfamily hydrolase (TIGR01484 family)
MIPKAVAFDIDETLTESKEPLTPEMAALLARLMEQTKVAAVSGGKFEIFLRQIYERLPQDANFANLYSVPTAGAAMYEYRDGAWTAVYEEVIDPSEAERVMAIVDRVARESGAIDYSQESWGERIEFRKSSITLSALGQTAPIDAKKAWDPSGEKRNLLRERIGAALPDYDVKRGGATSIDITKPGINKAYGVRKLSEHLGTPLSEMLYVGDALFPGGNDEVVKETGIPTRQVKDPAETAEVITGLLA